MNKKLISEFIGTFILVFAGCGAIVVESLTGALGHVGIALTFGFVVSALIYTFGHISGAHFNPAVTISFALMNEFDKKDVLKYIISQISGAILASLFLLLLFLEEAKSMKELAYLGATLPRGSWYQSFGFEFILTFILMLVIYGSAVHGKAIKSFAGMAIGLTVGLEAMFAGPICGASMNPARSIAPAIVSGNFEHLWIYIVATTLGAIAAGIVFIKYIKCKNQQECGA
ncbi:MAG: MIP family channel protein [Campylobacterota bacterium]|nr:MIP family channel protein [Campylobacterota bacterium]